MKTPILGSTYVAPFGKRCRRMHDKLVPRGAGRGMEPAFLQRCPGLQLQQVVGQGLSAGCGRSRHLALIFMLCLALKYSDYQAQPERQLS